jgi:hypothetical protein
MVPIGEEIVKAGYSLKTLKAAPRQENSLQFNPETQISALENYHPIGVHKNKPGPGGPGTNATCWRHRYFRRRSQCSRI